MTWADALPEMRKTTTDHPVRRQLGAEKALAAMKRLMNFACFRVGDERDMKARDLNFYVKQVMGDEFTPKDLRVWAGTRSDIARASYVSPRVIDHCLEGSVVAYRAEHFYGVIAAEQGDLTDAEKALPVLLKKEPRRDLGKAA